MFINVKFLKSLQKYEENLELENSVVFLGRSNVGKSSLINALCKQKIAKSSSTPGKTRLVNLFQVKCKFSDTIKPICLIDLPGFGYARVSKSLKKEWNTNLDEFLKKEKSIKIYVHLIDSRHVNLDIDKEISLYLNSILKDYQSIVTVFTKSDKLNQSQKAKLKNTQAILSSSLKRKDMLELENELIKRLFV